MRKMIDASPTKGRGKKENEKARKEIIRQPKSTVVEMVV